MRLSRYVIAYRDVRAGEHVLYDVVADRYVGLDDAGLAAVDRWRDAPPAPGSEGEAAEALAGMGFVVHDDAADAERLRGALAGAASGMAGTAYVTLMPTLACDLSCSYCIQKDHETKGHMRPEVEEAALAWIERALEGSGAGRLVVHYIGGEPLTRKDYVLRTARRLAARCRAQGRTFSWELTTNGVSLDLPFARALAAVAPGSIKVTIDGDRETHDEVRVFRDGRGSFDRVFLAMAAVARECPEIQVRVGGNFLAGQERSFERLLDRMVTEGLAGRVESVRFKPVVADGGCGAACGAGGADTLVQLGRATVARGLAPRMPGSIDEVVPCELHWERSWVIDPAGLVYKCLAVAGRPELAIGDVRGGALRPDPLTARRPWESCGDCPFVPVCLGGCLGGRAATGAEPGTVMCQRPAFEARFLEQVTGRYLEEFHPEDAASDVPPPAAIDHAA